MANEKQIDKICRMLDDLITKSKRDTNSEPVKEQLKSPDFYEGYKIGFESAQPKWISVEDKQPNVDDIIYSYQVDSERVDISRVMEVNDYGLEVQTVALCPGDNYLSLVWAPVYMPEPPKEET